MQRLISARTRTGVPLNTGLNCSDPAFPALLPRLGTQVLPSPVQLSVAARVLSWDEILPGLRVS